MLSRRVVVCLDVKNGRVVKGVRFAGLKEVGDPAALAAIYQSQGADEIVFLNIVARRESQSDLLATIRRAAAGLFIPLTVGGGVASVDDVGSMLRAGADKVAINSAAVRRPSVIREAAERFGSQCIVASIDAKRDGALWRVYTSGGRSAEQLDALTWARKCEDLGAGEIVLTSIDRDGMRNGYDVELTRLVSESVAIPVVASGGFGRAEHVVDAFVTGGADAALVAGALHDGSVTIDEIKSAMSQAGIPARKAA